ncbi:MAG: response regulator [Magnetococcus sp. DMHC-8]
MTGTGAPPRKVLIVDDHPPSVVLLQSMLEGVCDCAVATSGQDALMLFQQAQTDGDPFDVVLLDIFMPDLDGIETLKRLRKLEMSHREVQLFGRQTGLTRIIMQTISDNPQDFLDAYLEGRCNGYIQKPYSREEIIAKVCATGAVV